MRVDIVTAATDADFADMRELLGEYADHLASLWPDMDRVSFCAERDALPEPYVPPRGLLLLAREGGETAGGIGYRQLEPDVVEARRLFVRPGFRRLGVGRALMTRLMDEARERGYSRMRLVTVPLFEGALPLYESLGFRRIPAYRDTIEDIVVSMELDLTRAGQ